MKVFTREVATREDDRRRGLRDDRIRRVIASGKTELRRADLTFGRHWIEDTDGNFWRVSPNADPAYSDHCPAYFFDEAGDAVLLERADPASREELEQKRAGLAARRAARDAEAQQRREQKKALSRR